MRVGLTLYGSIEERSGGFRYDRKLVEQLQAAGDTVEIIELPWRDYHRGLLDNASPGLRQRLDVDVDVMLQDELAHPSLVHTNRHLPYPIVSIVHHLRASEPGPLAPLYRAVERRYLETVDGVVCNSTVTRDVVTALGVDADATAVAPPACDQFDPDIDEETIQHRAKRRPLQVVFVGNIEPRKGLDTLVEALTAVDAELTVVGRTVEESHVEDIRGMVDAYGLDDRVTFTGELLDEELARTLRESQVLAVPSRYEGFGIVYLEGMSFGLPAIASRAGGATDIVTDGENGVLVDPDDPDAVAETLARLEADPERLGMMSQAARRRYEQQPSWAEAGDRVRRLLSDISTTVVPT